VIRGVLDNIGSCHINPNMSVTLFFDMINRIDRIRF